MMDELLVLAISHFAYAKGGPIKLLYLPLMILNDKMQAIRTLLICPT